MTKQEIIDYVMTTPSNPNRAVLNGMLDSIAQSGGGTSEPLIVNFSVQNGYEVLDKTWTEIDEAIMSGRNVYLDYPIGSERPHAYTSLTSYVPNDQVGFGSYSYNKVDTFDPYPAYDPG